MTLVYSDAQEDVIQNLMFIDSSTESLRQLTDVYRYFLY